MNISHISPAELHLFIPSVHTHKLCRHYLVQPVELLCGHVPVDGRDTLLAIPLAQVYLREGVAGAPRPRLPVRNLRIVESVAEEGP